MKLRAGLIAVVAVAMMMPCAVAADPVACARPRGLTMITPPLTRSAERFEAGQKLVIVAIGSSSTAGAGASTPTASYPSRLEAELKTRAPGIDIRVINRGKGGEDAPEELARLDRDVIAQHPDLVIWQVGTNAILRRDDLSIDAALIRRGVDMLKNAGIDVVLMDLQYAPLVLDRPGYATMQEIVAEIAEQAQIGLFRRFALMRHWQRADEAGVQMIAADGLHMNDASYGCLAASLADALASNWGTYVKTARSRAVVSESVAGLAAAPRDWPADLLSAY